MHIQDFVIMLSGTGLLVVFCIVLTGAFFSASKAKKNAIQDLKNALIDNKNLQ